MDHPKWFTTSRDLKEGDIVLFLKHDSEISSTYQYGMIETVERGRDQRIRKVEVKCRNHNEEFDRRTYRSTRSLVMIHPVDEMNIMQEIGSIAKDVNSMHRTSLSANQ